MEHLFSLTVKGLALIYILYKVFRFLFGKQGKNRWHFLTPKIREKEGIAAQVRPEQNTRTIIGKSQTVYIEKPPQEKRLEPVFSEDLQKLPAYEEEPDISPDDVEDYLDEGILTEEERFIPLNMEPDGEALSTGMTYEQISGVLDVVQGKKTKDKEKLTAARILYEVQGGELFDFLAAQAENEAIIERLLKENLDDAEDIFAENRKKRRRETVEFDMEKYV